MLFYGMSPAELAAYAAWMDRRDREFQPEYATGWYVGTFEYERRRAEAEWLLAEYLAGKDT